MESNEAIARIVTELSDAAALFQEDGVLVHCNPGFEILTRFHKPLRQKLGDCIIEMNKSEREFHKRYDVPSLGLDIFVYFLDPLLPCKNLCLILIKSNVGKEAKALSSPFRENAPLIDTWSSHPKKEKLPPVFEELMGEDDGFKAALFAAHKAARTELPVLIMGESGTGKEILAQTIHRASRRSKKVFLDINCGAIPDNLIESELFGYEGGAFTGARAAGRSGLFEQAHEGTLFMDEIGDASLQIQTKVLRVLQDGRFRRVGGNRSINVDVRIISATNKDLSKFIENGAFREDLFYRINTIKINLPPLRERRGDIRLLLEHFLKEHCSRGKIHTKFSPDALEILESYRWPGNVRELKGVVDYAVTMSSKSVMAPDDLPAFLYSKEAPIIQRAEIASPRAPSLDDHISLLPDAVRNVEKELIGRVLGKCKNKSEAIKTLGISRRTFYIKLKEYNL